MIRRMLTFIKRFLYYGYHGAKYTSDYDAECLHSLIYAHMMRVNDFMHNPKLTHLLWNSDAQNKPMRQLREFVELSKRMHTNDLSGYFRTELRNSHEEFVIGLENPEYRKKYLITLKKDAMIRKGLVDRYWHLLRYRVPHFWD